MRKKSSLSASFMSLGLCLPFIAEGAIPCPAQPAAIPTIGRDVRTEVNAAAGALGKFKAVQLGGKVEITTKSLYEKFPNADKLYLVQTMMATYCTMLTGTSLSDREKITRWEVFQDKIISTIAVRPPSPVKIVRQIESSPSPRKADAETVTPQPITATPALTNDTKAKAHRTDRCNARTEIDLLLSSFQPQIPLSGLSKDSQVRPVHILVNSEAEAHNVIALFTAGLCWSELAKKFSIDPESSGTGGDLGASATNDFVVEFQNAVRGLSPGTYSSVPIKTQFGWHVVGLIWASR